ncbi:fibronectin type III domain-containing protein [Winogradskyella echinorum]|uniref:Fibronectin type III domain-containing protein n=1 Tax=Winogradskyella echinorum TaxID=538189 RepID=A0ABR6XZG3_9FLAO|nr:fibronectin type III domain-containing protein [Winogradskyella echinorum]MBC3845871.1 fibronectin type III domain-containing protein [Winogradskyella echinorum]MBC5750219.1 fibronectin type III domain-containing protein [Winogradskyella echinorum]
MKKITLILFMLGFFLTASAQYDFAPIVGPTNVASGSPVTINLNDAANAAGVTASTTGSYDSFSITVDWVAGGGNPWSSEADITVTTTAGAVLIDPPTAGGLGSNANTTLTFEGDFTAIYDPTTDGYIDLILNQSFGGSNADWSNITVTLFESPSCIEPSSMSVSGVTSDSAILDWVAGDAETSWNIEYNSGADFTPGNGEEENALSITTSPNTTLTTLTPATTYYVYYQADCAANGLSLWVGPFIFGTECVTFTAPFTEDFENAGDIPLCWSMTGENWLFDDDASGSHVGDNGTITGSTASNNYFAWSDASGNDGPRTLTSPLVDVSGLTTPALSFYEISDNEGNANSNLNVEVWDGAAWNDMGTFNTNTVGWELKIIDLGSLTITGDVQARFTFSETETGDFYDDIAIDDVTFDEAPSCFNPSMLMVNAITSNSAEFSWTQGGTAVSWNVEIVPAGTAPTSTPTASNVTNPYDASSLSAVTSYDFYVQANCGAELSGWTGPLTFTTLCDVFVPDYIENFTTVTATVPPNCWEEADSGNATTGPGDLGAGSWTADEFLNVGTDDGAYKINLFAASKSDWIISPQFDLTGGPFQVEFDFAITTWNSSTATEPLGSDDTVQLLITTDNGANWTELLLYDSSSVVPIPGIHPVVDLTAYSGQIVQFGIYASEGTVNDPEDIDVFVDNFRVRNIPTCPEPTDLTATSIDLTSAEVSWTEAGTSAAWNIEYGETGFALGTGTVEAGVSTNPFTLSNLNPDTSYEFYVQAICAPGNESSYAGPFQFFVGYCESLPSSNDGSGVNNVTIGIIDFPSLGDVTYENQTSPVINVFQGINTTVEIEFGHTFSYDTNIWIDFNDDVVFDASELVFQGESTGGSNPHTLDASFVMPLTATLGEHRMRIGSADFGQATPDPCYDGAWGVTLDFTVNIQELTCTLPEADYTVVPDCDNDQFYIDVNVTSLGDATSLEISNNLDTSTVQATATQVYQAGPFPFGSTVKVFVTNEQDNNCVISSENFEVLACPPLNDDCVGAIAAVVNATSTCDDVTSGTILAATPSGVPDGTCTGSTNDDVWFTFEALAELQIISILNITGGTFNIDHAVYSGSCGTLTELYCSDDDASVTPQLTIGETYYIRVFSGGSQPETSTFDLCIRPAPTNIICENAENFCSVGGGPLTTPNIIGIPSSGQVACLFTAPNPTWNIIQIGDPGLIEIEINQQDSNGNGLDVDFVIWGPFTSVEQACTDILLEDCPTCPNNTTNPNFYPFGNIVDCSYSAASVENLTIDNAQSGEIYMLLVTNFNGNAGDITIEQTNTGGGNIEAEITAEITSNEVVFIDTDSNPATPVEANVCGFDSVTIETNSPFADEFVWYKDGFVMEGETSSTLVVTESNNYQVQAYDNQCGAEAFSDIVIINLYTDPGNIDLEPISVCDSQTSLGEEFDLGEYTTSLNLGDQYAISYYTNTTDANQAINPVGPIYTSTGETLVVRIEDINASNNGFLGCRSLVDLELIVGPDLCVFPQGISPGVSPGINDSFDLSNFDVTKLEIFNRNGTLVYSKKNYTNEWVGQTNDGKELPVGTYFYTMEYAGGTQVRSAWIYINR